MSTPEEEAREKAEARQRRIKENATNRMSVIEGYPAAGAGDDDDADAAKGVDADADADADAGDAVVAVEDASPKKKSSSAGAARMAAMRRRRFNKAAAAAEAETETPSTDETPAPATAATDDDDKSKTDATTATEETTATTVTTEASPTTEEEELTEMTTAEGDSEKKYMGVAKMRRRRLMEKKQKEAEEEAGNASTGKALIAAKKKKNKKTLLDRLPILMHAVTVLLLFIAGLDIGMQQHHDYGDDIVVHADFAPRQHGLQILKKFGVPKVPSFITKMMESKTVEKTITVDGEELQEDVPVIDEFATDDDSDDDTPENLDPLFGIDLDKITKGPGLLLFLARGAIFLHRLNLKMFYYFPRRMFSTIVGTVKGLVDTPPIMALSALTVRQLIGKILLGAKLPAKVKDAKKSTDVMSMGMNMVKTFILGSFPTLVSMYDAWTHLRSDMYIVLCGLFVGVVWHHYVSPSDASSFLQDVPDLTESVSDSLADEL